MRDRNDLATAERAARAGLRLDPEDWDGHRELGNILERKGDATGAKAAFAEADRLEAEADEMDRPEDGVAPEANGTAAQLPEEEQRTRLEELVRLHPLPAEKRRVLEDALSKASSFSAEASKDLAHTIAGGGGSVEKQYFYHGALLADLMKHPDLAAHFALSAPKLWLKLLQELEGFYYALRGLSYDTANLGKRATKRVQAEYRAAGKPFLDFFSSKQGRALLDKFVEYWTALPPDLRPAALDHFLRTYGFYCGETDMVE